MKAIVVKEFGGPEVLALREFPIRAPGRGEVLVALRSAGVNPVETYIRSGAYPLLPKLPYVPGTDGAGVIEAVGPDVSDLVPGDRVYLLGSLTGTYAEKTLCRAEDARPLPENITFEEGAAINIPYITAARALWEKGSLESGRSVLVRGASGAVGLAAVQLASLHLAPVFGTASTEPGREAVLAAGAQEALTHDDVRLAEIAREQPNAGFDLILEMRADINLDSDLDLLAKRGRVVIVGNRGRTEIDPRKIMGRDASVIGLSYWNATAEEKAAALEPVERLLFADRLRPVIGKRFPLSQADRAHKEILEGPALGKIVLMI